MPCRYQKEEDVLVKRNVGDVFYNSTDHFFFPNLFFFTLFRAAKSNVKATGRANETSG